MEASHHSFDQRLHQAIEQCDHDKIVMLYSEAADFSEQHGHIDEACFFLTQAYVYALQQGSPRAATLRSRLIEYGRES